MLYSAMYDVIIQHIWTESQDGCKCEDNEWRLREADIDHDAWLDLESSDLLHLLDWAVQVDHSLVQSQFKSVPGITTFTTWGLTGGDSQGLGWDPDWSSELVVHLLGLLNDLVAHVLQRLDFFGGEGQSIIVEKGKACLILLSSSGASSPLVLSLSILIIVLYNTTNIRTLYQYIYSFIPTANHINI